MLINKAECKKELLKCADLRAHKFTRVSANVYEMLDDALRAKIQSFVRSHPSVGVTLSTGEREKPWETDAI